VVNERLVNKSVEQHITSSYSVQHKERTQRGLEGVRHEHNKDRCYIEASFTAHELNSTDLNKATQLLQALPVMRTVQLHVTSTYFVGYWLGAAN